MVSKKKKFGITNTAYVIVSIGALILLYGLFQMWNSNSSQAEALDTAKSMVVSDEYEKYEKDFAHSFQTKEGSTFGVLHIPKLQAELPIIEGTGVDELEKGVGHYVGTSFPEQQDQIVLSGHRDTVFRNLGKLTEGDIITIEMPYGKYKYKLKETEIVGADDRTIIKSTAPEEVLTLTTCYPFNYLGDAPDRYIVYAEPVLNNGNDLKNN